MVKEYPETRKNYNMKTNVIVFAIVAVIIIGCSKKDDNSSSPFLPPITQTGENTFGCYINGKLLTPRDGSGTFNATDNGMSFINVPGPRHEIDVHDFASKRTAKIILHIMNLDSIGIGEYEIGESNCLEGFDSPLTNNIHCRVYDFNENIYKMYCSIPNSGTIYVSRYDNGILSGTFSCTAVNRDNPNEFIEITKGRFDINGYSLRYTKFP